MKVLFISGADQKYGTYHITIQLLANMTNTNEHIDFIVLTQKHGPINEWCDRNQIVNYVIPYRYCVYYPSSNRLMRAIKHTLKTIQVSSFNAFALYRIKKLGLMNDVDIIHTNINRDLIGVYLARKYRIPNITYLREFSRSHFHLEPIYKKQIELMNEYSSRFIAISNAVKEDWIDYGIDGTKIDVIYDGVDTKLYNGKRSYSTDSHSLRIVMCGAIYEGKGQFDLLLAIAPLIKAGASIYADFYGDSSNDNYYRALKDFVAKNELSKNVVFKGHSNNLNEVLNNYDVGVVCSRAEGFGLVTIEYLLSGLIVIASDTGANSEILQNGKYGLIYPCGNPRELQNAIARIYENNGLIIDWGKNAVGYAKREFSIENTVSKLMKKYYDLI